MLSHSVLFVAVVVVVVVFVMEVVHE